MKSAMKIVRTMARWRICSDWNVEYWTILNINFFFPVKIRICKICQACLSNNRTQLYMRQTGEFCDNNKNDFCPRFAVGVIVSLRRVVTAQWDCISNKTNLLRRHNSSQFVAKTQLRRQRIGDWRRNIDKLTDNCNVILLLSEILSVIFQICLWVMF